MPLRLFELLTGGKLAEDGSPSEPVEVPREPSTINEKTLGDFIRMVRQMGILKLPKGD